MHAARVRRHDHRIRNAAIHKMLREHHLTVQMIHRNVEKPLNLPAMQIRRQYAIHPRRHNQVRHQFRRDRHARPILAILSRIAEIRQHRRDARRRSATGRIDQNQQFEQMIIHRRRRAIDDEHVLAANVFAYLNLNFTVAELVHRRAAQLNAEMVAHAPRQVARRIARKHPHLFAVRHVATTPRCSHDVLAGAVGFEPTNVGSKGRCRTTWLRPTTQSRGPQRVATMIATNKASAQSPQHRRSAPRLALVLRQKRRRSASRQVLEYSNRPNLKSKALPAAQPRRSGTGSGPGNAPEKTDTHAAKRPPRPRRTFPPGISRHATGAARGKRPRLRRCDHTNSPNIRRLTTGYRRGTPATRAPHTCPDDAPQCLSPRPTPPQWSSHTVSDA